MGGLGSKSKDVLEHLREFGGSGGCVRSKTATEMFATTVTGLVDLSHGGRVAD